ncbi:hypothetical protein NIES19_54580 [Anabaena cylindrica PCC 7122]|nr:hypothetical protein NIES19_54580 [Anabaena cylindrica PCC 7122]
MQSAELGNLQIEQVTTDKFKLAYELRKKLNDKPYISFKKPLKATLMASTAFYLYFSKFHLILVS